MSREPSKMLFEMIGNLIACYRNDQISDIDLYNSIIRLIFTADEKQRENLKGVVEWL